MALQNFDYDMDIIAKLDDEPNDVGGMSAADLKAKFDEGGKAIQDFINNVLLPALINGHTIEDSSGTKLDNRPVIRFLNSRLSVAEDAIIIDPANGKDGADGTDGKSAYESAKDGGYTGTEEEFNADLATVGEKAEVSKVVDITMAAASWSELDIGYKQTVVVTGGNANTLVSLEPTPVQIVALQNDGVTALMVNNDGGTFEAYAIGEKPTADMTVQAKLEEVVR